MESIKSANNIYFAHTQRLRLQTNLIEIQAVQITQQQYALRSYEKEVFLLSQINAGRQEIILNQSRIIAEERRKTWIWRGLTFSATITFITLYYDLK